MVIYYKINSLIDRYLLFFFLIIYFYFIKTKNFHIFFVSSFKEKKLRKICNYEICSNFLNLLNLLLHNLFLSCDI